MYITYAEYQALGGTLSETAFNLEEKKARKKLDFFTFNRIDFDTLEDEDIESIKELMTMFINKMSVSSLGAGVTSYSNGIESIGYSDSYGKSLQNELHELAIEYLPIDLVSCSTTPEDYPPPGEEYYV